ncbi:MAG: hypothetical protein KME32_10645 [Mojavia pulchra JT2-VF2]|uniref:Uncharacterized protein n=1 Tax=Mojavia pulchra JT2-VF2 TaxID=287848 RepID=A0A951PXD1_9NOST|nr:hypothetical protein [Mojavia pulchra JT2-VF2]
MGFRVQVGKGHGAWGRITNARSRQLPQVRKPAHDTGSPMPQAKGKIHPTPLVGVGFIADFR